jgi:hypothetical protein
MPDTPKPCAQCGEGAELVTYYGESVVRVCRISRCKLYRRSPGHGCRKWCQTAVYSVPEKAVQEWNRTKGKA